MQETGRPATAADVAAHAGVSRATVSHILNGREARFPQSTRDRVRASAAALDYRPSPAGLSLARGRGDTIVFLMPNTTMESNIQDAVEWVTRATAHVGANVVLRLADDDLEVTVGAILRMRPLGVIDLGSLPASARARLALQGVPTAPSLDEPTRTGTTDPDETIARIQVAELLRRGPRRIVYAGLADRRLDVFGPRRFEEIERACAELGAPPPPYLHLPIDAAEAAALLDPYAADGPVGVAAFNDSVALTVLAAATDRGWPVPERISVVGNDDVSVGRLWRPRLTTIRVDVRAVFDRAVAELLLASRLPASPLTVDDELGIELVVRESS